MLKVHTQEKAEDDLIDIWLYSLEKWGIAQADQYLSHLNQSIKSIAANPDIGTACDYVRAGYRKLHSREHYIFYKYTTNAVVIMRILGDEMDYQPILQNNDN